MAQNQMVMLSGGPQHGTRMRVEVHVTELEYLGDNYVRTGEESTVPGDPGTPGPGGTMVKHTFPVFALV